MVSGGCLDLFWNMTPDSEDDDSVVSVETPSRPSPSPVDTVPPETIYTREMMPENADNQDATATGNPMNYSSPGSFSLTYTPPDGYVAEEDEILAMQVRVIPEDGFSASVSLRLDIVVPSPVLPVVTLWSGSYDLGTISPPYPPVVWSLPLDPENPPEGYEWVTGVARQAKALGISTVSVNVRVTAASGEQMVTESPSYTVRLS
ncbi:hypothetical protein JCM10550A_06670 [Methanogenium cariaci]